MENNEPIPENIKDLAQQYKDQHIEDWKNSPYYEGVKEIEEKILKEYHEKQELKKNMEDWQKKMKEMEDISEFNNDFENYDSNKQDWKK